ncbi:hypothetical protein JRI60_00770 [Archangium violaceum]|uniref:hypothetical protein n=1 Tax=Archangium violaceum TaxID=83451 RepID=UPI00194E6A15|nr:hypothetical protein [Archangium violaceum]QRN97657.1 hypothetical protein JRI60_00770 [Archangium violaceum]
MPELKIDVGAGTKGPRSLFIKLFTEAELAALFIDQYRSVWTARARKFMKQATAMEKVTWGGRACTLIRHTSVPAADYVRLKSVLATTMDCLGQCPSLTLSAYPIEFLIDSTPGSAGYVIQDKRDAPKKISVFLGSDVWGFQRTNTRIIANYLHKYIRSSSEAEKARRRTLAAVFHEFGHVFHQLTAPSHYFMLGILGILQGRGQSELRKEEHLHSMWRMFPGFPSVAYMKQFHRGIEQYARTQVSGYASEREPEIVAEVFSGLMMGITFAPDTKTLYEALGGHVPEDVMRYETQEVAKISDLIHHWSLP